MTLNDPLQPYYPVKRKETPPPDPLAEFGAEYRMSMARPSRTRPPATPGPWCVFKDGREVQRGQHCPHFREDSDG